MFDLFLHIVGAMVGALVGDCLGNYWEMMPWVGTHPLDEVRNSFISIITRVRLRQKSLIRLGKHHQIMLP